MNDDDRTNDDLHPDLVAADALADQWVSLHGGTRAAAGTIAVLLLILDAIRDVRDELAARP